jgi:hypothetical protein
MTAQAHEILILNGEKISIDCCPPLPDNDSRIVELKDDSEIEKKSRHDSIILSTACWRNYIGTWEVKNNKFYLVDIYGRFKVKESPIFADWFTGVISIPQGEVLHYIHMGFATVYEREQHIKIENGVVVESKVIDNRNKKIDELELASKYLFGSENLSENDDV